MAKNKGTSLAVPSDQYQTQDDMNTLMRHSQLVSDKSRHSKVMGIMRNIIGKQDSSNQTLGRKVKRDNSRAVGRS